MFDDNFVFFVLLILMFAAGYILNEAKHREW